MSLALVLTSDHEEMKLITAVVAPATGLGFLATGLYARWRRPGNTTGGLMILVGFLWFGRAFGEANAPWVFAVGGVLSLAFYAGLAHLLLAFPGGRLGSRHERVLVAVIYVAAVGHPLTQRLLKPLPLDEEGDPRNVLLLTDRPALAQVVDSTWAAIALVGFVLVARELVLRRRRASHAPRRGLAPVLCAGAIVLGGLVAAVVAQSAGIPGVLSDLMIALSQLAFLALPYAFLAGLLRVRYSRAGAVDDLIAGLARAGDRQNLRDSLATALGDPTLDLAFRRADRDEWVDASGRPFALPAPADPARAVTLVERDGEPMAALVHDGALREEPELLATAAAAASLAVDNDRLNAELRARIGELEDSRDGPARAFPPRWKRPRTSSSPRRSRTSRSTRGPAGRP